MVTVQSDLKYLGAYILILTFNYNKLTVVFYGLNARSIDTQQFEGDRCVTVSLAHA
jgi:hypothetical protein